MSSQRKKEKKKRRLATRITFNIVTFGRDKRCEKPGLDFKPFVRLNYSLKLNFSRSRRVLIVSKVFKNFEFEKKRTGISILTLRVHWEYNWTKQIPRGVGRT